MDIVYRKTGIKREFSRFLVLSYLSLFSKKSDAKIYLFKNIFPENKNHFKYTMKKGVDTFHCQNKYLYY